MYHQQRKGVAKVASHGSDQNRLDSYLDYRRQSLSLPLPLPLPLPFRTYPHSSVSLKRREHSIQTPSARCQAAAGPHWPNASRKATCTPYS